MNKVFIAGHLGGDPETRFTPSGQKVTSFTVATNSREGKEDVTIWWRVTVWGDRFDKLMPYLKKGSACMINGSMRAPRTYTGKDNQTQVSLEITADTIDFSPFGKKDANGQQGQQPQAQYGQPQQQQSQQRQPFGEQTFGTSAPSQGMAKQPMAVDEEEPPF